MIQVIGNDEMKPQATMTIFLELDHSNGNIQAALSEQLLRKLRNVENFNGTTKLIFFASSTRNCCKQPSRNYNFSEAAIWRCSSK